MSILCLDLGTKCGWALDEKHSGVWNLQPSRYDSAGIRFLNFKEELKTLFAANLITMVIFEEVRMHRGIDAAHIYGGLMAVLQTFCLEQKIDYRGVPVGTIKKTATGNGAAKKDAMIATATRLFPKINVIDDNHADALCILHWANHHVIQ